MNTLMLFEIIMFSFLKQKRLLVCLLIILYPFSAIAGNFSESDYLTGNWNGQRDELQKQGISGHFQYDNEFMANVSGGEKHGSTYSDNIGLELEFDLDKLLGINKTTFLIKVSQRNGKSVSRKYVAPSEGGNTFTVQEAFGDHTGKLVNVQFNALLLDDQFELAYGRLVANDDFLRSPLYCQFVNNSFCGSPKPVFLQDPFTFSAYPTSQWGARGRYDTDSRKWTFQAAVYDGDPTLQGGDPTRKGSNMHGTDWDFGDNGAVFASEIHYHINRDSRTALPGVYKIGGYYMNGDYRDISKTDNSTTADNAMFWVLADQMFYREKSNSNKGLYWFGSLVFSLEDKVNSMDDYFNTGLLYEGFFSARPKDITGLAITAGWYSDELNKARKSEAKKKQNYEAVIELNHKFVLNRGISITPDIQYVIKPAGTGDIDDAFLIGAKLSIQF